MAAIADLAGFRVTVVDDRETFANAERFPMAAACVAGPWEDALKSIETGSNTYVVIVTRGHAMDGTCLKWALGTKARYIGMIGSRRKIRAIYDDCRASGLTDEALKKVHAPVGLNLGATTSEEIAVAIVAEMVGIRRGALPGDARPTSDLARGAIFPDAK